MSKDLIDNLVDDLKPVEVLWPPYVRAIIWFTVFFLAAAIGMYFRQDYREPLSITLMTPNMFSLSLWSGFIAAFFLSLDIFSSTIPGFQRSKTIRFLGYLSLIISFSLVILEIFFPSLQATDAGSRPHCNLEVLVYGLAGSSTIYLLLKKGLFRISSSGVFLLTASSALIPALLMQSACMYEPMHNFLHHILPAVAVGIINGFIAYKMKK